ncbi:MAG TPA: hypothetical protein VN023_09610 [Methylovorus sp.]|nr:hypothetical protein [Methylovorus sp.]
MIKWIIGNPYLALCAGMGIIIVWAGSLVWVAIWRGDEVRQMVEGQWKDAYIEASNRYTEKIIETEGMYRAVENKRAEDARDNSIKAKQEAIANAKRYETIIAGITAGTIKLRDPYAASGNQASGIRLPEAGADTSGADGGTTGELSGRLSGFLFAQAERADDKVILLNQCIRQLKADRAAY